MKRKFSLILALLMIINILSPLVAFASDQTDTKRDENLIEKIFASKDEEVLDNITDISITFYTLGDEYDFTFPYSDDWFKREDSIYQHKLCQGSLGLAVAGFRYTLKELGMQDVPLIKYYDDAGFTDIETYNYENMPSDDTISNGIARKTIDDFTLLSVSVCGGGYRDEWVSNLTAGNGIRHEGFNNAATQVEERIYSYIEKYGITGNIKVWITGFSRAAAVSNLVGADLTSTGRFTSVFGYHFATPNNTTEENTYNNLFSIVGKNDPVPFVTFEEWGYHRFGTVFYTPSGETDSDYSIRLERASVIFEEMTDEKLQTSASINKSLRLILLNILDMIPNSEVYTESVQDAIIEAWHSKSSTSDLLVFASGILNELGKADPEIQSRTSALGEYILNLGVELATKNPNSVYSNDLYNEYGSGANLLREHMPMTYIAWVFSSDDPDEIYSGSSDFTRLYITGDVSVSIYDSEGLLETIDNGVVSRQVPKYSLYDLSPNTNELLFVSEANKLELIIPKDKNYLIQVHAEKGSFSYEGVSFSGRMLLGQTIEKDTVSVDEGSNYYILSRSSREDAAEVSYEDSCELIESASYESPTVLLAMENANIFHLTFEQIQNFAKLNAVILIVIFIQFCIRAIRTIIYRKKASRVLIFGVNLCLCFIFMLLYEQADIYLDSIPMVRTILGILTMFTVLHLCYVSMRPINKELSGYFLFAILITSAGNLAKQYYDIDVSTILYTLSCVVITMGIMKQHKPSRKNLYIWFIASILLSVIVSIYLGFIPVWMVAYILAITAMNIAAGDMDARLRLLIGAFMMPGALSAWESYTGGNVKIHTILVLAYSCTLLLMVAIILYSSYRSEKKLNSMLHVNIK